MPRKKKREEKEIYNNTINRIIETWLEENDIGVQNNLKGNYKKSIKCRAIDCV